MALIQSTLDRVLRRPRNESPEPAPVVEVEPPPTPTLIPVEAVRLGYRLFLGREVEEGADMQLAATIPSLDALRHYFLNMGEFRNQYAPKRSPALSGAEPPMEVEGAHSEDDLRTLFRHIQDTWQRFGELEPHWSVATAKKFLQENIEENRLEFHQSGKWDADRLFGALVRNHIDPSRLKSCVEIGCGVARVTPWLARRFESVIGYDISSAHLRVARDYLDEKGIGNVRLEHLTRLDDLRSLPRVDATFTVVVLQHNPPPVIKMMIEEMIRSLNPGGVAFFQVPTYRVGYRFNLAEYLAKDALGNEVMEMHVLPQEVIFDLVDREGARLVEVIEDIYTICRDGELSETFLVQKR